MVTDGAPDWARVVIIDLDVTDLRLAEHNIAQGNRLEALGSIAAGVAHELNTPLQYVSDNMRFIADSMTSLEALFEEITSINDPDRFPRLAELIRSCDLEFLQAELPAAVSQSLDGVTAMAKIVRALKEFSHAGSPEKEASDLNKLVMTSVEVCRNEWKNIAEVDLELAADLPSVAVHRQAIRQVILNLTVNAAHAIREHDCGQACRIRIRTYVDRQYATVEIIDTGGGVPDHLRDRIFDPFFTTKEPGKGSGQGLAMARKTVVGHHGGRLDLDVEDGIGSTFRIKLPLQPVEQGAAAA